MEKDPWDFHRDLTRERLIAIGAALLVSRNEVLDRREPDKGDDAYATGTRAFSWQCHAIREMDMGGTCPWLSLANSTQEFVFRIGEVPARFYRGDHERPSSRTLRQTFPELQQDRLPLGDDGWTTADIIWRFVIETFHDGEVERIMFCGFEAASARPVCVWEIPVDYSVDDEMEGETWTDAKRPNDWAVTGDEIPAPIVSEQQKETGSGEESK